MCKIRFDLARELQDNKNDSLQFVLTLLSGPKKTLIYSRERNQQMISSWIAYYFF